MMGRGTRHGPLPISKKVESRMDALTAVTIGALTVSWILSNFGIFMIGCYLFRKEYGTNENRG